MFLLKVYLDHKSSSPCFQRVAAACKAYSLMNINKSFCTLLIPKLDLEWFNSQSNVMWVSFFKVSLCQVRHFFTCSVHQTDDFSCYFHHLWVKHASSFLFDYALSSVFILTVHMETPLCL